MNRATGLSDSLQLLLTLFFALIVLAGGASQFFLLTDIVTRLAAIGMIFLLLWNLGPQVLPRAAWLAVGAASIIPLFQLTPLPVGIWSLVPGTERALAILAAAGIEARWQVLTISPSRTLDSLLFLFVPVGAVMLGYQANTRLRFMLLKTIVILACGSMLLGLVQLYEGEGGASYLYAVTNDGSAVGIFANRNHHGIFLAIAILLIWPITARLGETVSNILALRIGALALAIFLFAGTIMTQSRAALALGCIAMLVILITLALQFKDKATPFTTSLFAWRYSGLSQLPNIALPAMIMLLLMAVVGPAAVIYVSLQNEGFNRAEVYPIISSALRDYWMFGSGLGSFEWLARGYENRSTISFAYWNHAHNDVAQLIVEAGLFGVGLLAAAVFWFVRILRRYLSAFPSPGTLVESSVVIFLMIAGHSLVDYPLRTASISAICFVLVGMVEADIRSRSEQIT